MRIYVVWGVLTVILCSAGCSSTSSWVWHFKDDPAEAGWVAGGRPPNASAFWLDEDQGVLWMRGKATWESPLIPVEPHQYYQVGFESMAARRGFVFVRYYKADGVTELMDYHDALPVSSGWEKHHINFVGRPEAAFVRIGFSAFENKSDDLTGVREVAVTPSDSEAFRQWADGLLEALPPVRMSGDVVAVYQPDGWRELFDQGGTVKMALLGDSIINDMSNSLFQSRVEALYPGLILQAYPVVRGSTGCWYYRHENRIRDRVMINQPDFLIIGGISHRNDIEAIRAVIHQARGMKPGMPILLLTGPFGFKKDADPRGDQQWTLVLDPEGSRYRDRLFALALEEGADFFDLQGAMGEYLLSHDRDYAEFQRDDVHANKCGAAVMAKLLENYFTPKRSLSE
jgi:hypothetical protein